MALRKRTTLPSTDCPVAQANFDPRTGLRNTTELIVIHTMDGFKAGTRATFANLNLTHKRSANYGVNMDGSIDWYVDEDLVAFHAADWEINKRSIGIEHEDFHDEKIVRSDALYESSSKLVADICKFYSIPCDRAHIIKHGEIVNTPCPGTLDIDRIIRRANELLGNAPAPTAMKATVITTWNLVVRNTPYLSGQKIDSLAPGTVIDVELEVNGDSYEGISKWWKLAGKQSYVWGGGVRIATTPTIPPPQGGTVLPPSDTDVVKAGFIVREALPALRSFSGQPFGSAEQAAREMVDRWPSYLQLITDYKEAKGLLDKLARLFGISS